MTYEINESTVGLWSVDLGPYGNILAHMARQADGSILIVVRLREYRDNVMGPESKDKRTWYEIKTKNGEARAIEKVRRAVEMWRRTQPTACGSWELLRGARSLDEFAELLMAMPGMHATVEKK